MTPQRLGDYDVLDVLGAGGMGVVYRARHAGNGREVAIKTVRVATESMLESIRREIHTLRELRHPGVIAVLDHGVDGATPWYAMELLRGRTLRDDFDGWAAARRHDTTAADFASGATRELGSVVTRELGERTAEDLGPPPHATATLGSGSAAAVRWPDAGASGEALGQVVRLFRKICQALAYVHGQGILHRDLSPANVFLIGGEAAVQPVLFDFGLAGQFLTASGREVLEIGGLLRGTAHYMAPEQARGDVVDARADVYSLGCMLYEALAGRPPFLAESPLAVLMRHCEDLALAPSMHRPSVPAALDSLVLHMLEKRPRDRIGYAEDVAAELAEIEGALRGAGAPTSSPQIAMIEATIAERPRAYVYRSGLYGRAELASLLEEMLFTKGPRDAGPFVATEPERGVAVALIGEGGVGKTRLAGELATRARERGLAVLAAECEAVGLGGAGNELHAAPLGPLLPLLRAVADRCRQGGPLVTEKLLGSAGGILAAYEPALAGLVPQVVDRVDPATARFRVLAVLGDTVRAYAREVPTLLVIDDLQRADELSLAALAALGQDVPGLGLLLTVRAEEMTTAIEEALAALGAAAVSVPRLAEDALAAMIRDMLALEDDAPAFPSIIAGRAEGNPWFATEYVRAAVDEGALAREVGGRWRLRDAEQAALVGLSTPGSVEALMKRRLAALSPSARHAARCAAVLGRAFSAAALAATAARDAAAMRLAVAELLRRHVLQESPGDRLRFGHEPMREQLYGELDLATRRELHRRAAMALEPAADAALWPELAVHWERCGELGKAVDLLERAAEHALATAAFGEARTLLRHMLELPVPAAAARKARWDRWLGEACFALGDLPAAASFAKQALEQLGHPLPRSPSGWAHAIAAGIGRQALFRLASSRRVPAIVRQPLSALAPGARPPRADEDTSPMVDAALACARMTSYYFFANDSVGVLGASLRAVNLAERAAAGVPVAEIYAQLGYVAHVAKLAPLARAYFAKARATAKATRDRSGLAWAYFTEAAAAIGNAELERARTVALKGLAIASELRNPQDVEVAHTILGHCDFASGDYAEALASARTLYDSAHARANRQHEAWGLYTVARAQLYMGDLQDALASFDGAAALLSGLSDEASQILCGGMRALTLAMLGRGAQARAQADAVTARIGGRTPPVFTIAEGFVCTVETYLELWRRGEASAARGAKAALANLARLARVFPIAQPASLALHGGAQLLAGRPRVARWYLERALTRARHLGLPYDEARALRGLGSLPGPGAAEAERAARQLYARLGCRHYAGERPA